MSRESLKGLEVMDDVEGLFTEGSSREYGNLSIKANFPMQLARNCH